MADNQQIKDIATLLSEFKTLKDDVKELKAYKAKTEKYGFFLMGMVALGTMIMSGFEKAFIKIQAILP